MKRKNESNREDLDVLAVPIPCSTPDDVDSPARDEAATEKANVEAPTGMTALEDEDAADEVLNSRRPVVTVFKPVPRMLVWEAPAKEPITASAKLEAPSKEDRGVVEAQNVPQPEVTPEEDDTIEAAVEEWLGFGEERRENIGGGRKEG